MKTLQEEFDHSKLDGPDASLEISLREYGLAWIIGEKYILFYYGTTFDMDEDHYTHFQHSTEEINADIKEAFHWANFNAVNNYCGGDFFNYDFCNQVQTLLSYYGPENMFGSIWPPGISYYEVIGEEEPEILNEEE